MRGKAVNRLVRIAFAIAAGGVWTTAPSSCTPQMQDMADDASDMMNDEFIPVIPDRSDNLPVQE